MQCSTSLSTGIPRKLFRLALAPRVSTRLLLPELRIETALALELRSPERLSGSAKVITKLTDYARKVELREALNDAAISNHTPHD